MARAQLSPEFVSSLELESVYVTLLKTTVKDAESDASNVPAIVGVLSLVVLEVTVGVVGSTVSWVANTFPLVVVEPPTVTEAVTATVPSATGHVPAGSGTVLEVAAPGPGGCVGCTGISDATVGCSDCGAELIGGPSNGETCRGLVFRDGIVTSDG